MRIDVNQSKEGIYELRINDEQILKHKMLSSVVSKIEQYLKMRFLPEEQKGGISGALDKLWKG